jgi:hypothetical protein
MLRYFLRRDPELFSLWNGLTDAQKDMLGLRFWHGER